MERERKYGAPRPQRFECSSAFLLFLHIWICRVKIVWILSQTALCTTLHRIPSSAYRQIGAPSPRSAQTPFERMFSTSLVLLSLTSSRFLLNQLSVSVTLNPSSTTSNLELQGYNGSFDNPPFRFQSQCAFSGVKLASCSWIITFDSLFTLFKSMRTTTFACDLPDLL